MLKINAIEIVYPDTPEAVSLAEILKRELESYRAPASVVKKTGKKSLADVTEPWLVVLCTPDTPSCGEVQERIKDFTARGLYNHILTLLIRGKPEESFPHALLYEERPDGTIIHHEPLAGNIKAPTRRKSLRLLSVEKLRLLAPFLGVSFDELRDRRRRARTRIALALAGVVLTGAAIFLTYALSRMRVISGQNLALQQQYAQAEEARIRAQAQRDAAREEYAGTTAIRAREVLNTGDTELAMLLCLEFLPEAGRTTELPEILSDALQKVTRKGYVPTTSVREFAKTRYTPKPLKEGPAEPFPKTITKPVPEEYDNGEETYELDLKVSSEEYGYAAYRGSFHPAKSSGANLYRTWVCFPDAPELDHELPYSPVPNGRLDPQAVLPDGSFIGIGSYGDYSFRYDPFTREFLPFYDAEEAENASGSETLSGDPEVLAGAGIYIGEAPGVPAEEEDLLASIALDSEAEKYGEVEGAEDLIFGYTHTTTYDLSRSKKPIRIFVFTKEPFRYVYTIDNVYTLIRPEGGKHILGLNGSSVTVFSADPFRYLYTLEDEYTIPLEAYYYHTLGFPDGRNWLYINSENGKAVYDLDTGKRISAITDPEQEWDMEITTEGLILTAVDNVPILWRPEDSSVIADIPGVVEDSPELYGIYDEVTGRRSADAVRISSMVYVYNEEEREVPGDLEGQVELAKELLNGRKLTRNERKTYSLEVAESEESSSPESVGDETQGSSPGIAADEEQISGPESVKEDESVSSLEQAGEVNE